jgi:hypothetical protein
MLGHSEHFHETELFQHWLKERGLEWPADPFDQHQIVEQFWKEGAEEAQQSPDRTWVGEEKS